MIVSLTRNLNLQFKTLFYLFCFVMLTYHILSDILAMLTSCAFKPILEIRQLKVLFKNQLLAISHNFVLESTIYKISFTDDKGCYFAAILKKDQCILHIEDEASASTVDEFMKVIVDRVKAVSSTFLFIDQSKHGVYTTDKITALLTDYSIMPHLMEHAEWHAESRLHKDISLNPEYEIRTLEPKHSLHIVNTHYRPDNEAVREMCVELINSNILMRPAFGIFPISNHSQPVAWITTYEASSLGPLHCMEEFRGQGFGRALVRHAMNVLSEIEGFTFVVDIHKDNEGSRKLFVSEGYVRIERNPLIVWVRKDIDM